MLHELKTDPGVFDAVAQGVKTYVIRRNDRGFAFGDTLVLRKTRHSGAEMAAGALLEYLEESLQAEVCHILRGPCYGLAADWVILGIRLTGPQALVDAQLLAQIGFHSQDINIVAQMAAARGLSVAALLRTAVRTYQVSASPSPDLPAGGCEAED